MKKIIILSYIFLFLVTPFVKGQYRIGDVTIDPILVEERDDTLFVQMEVNVDNKAMNSCQSWTIMPELTTEDGENSITLPHLLINGKRKANLYKRKVRFKNRALLSNPPATKVDAKKGKHTTVAYEFVAPYEQWMDTAYLDIHQILTSCADKEQWFVLRDIAPVKTQPYIPYVVQPHVNFITPPKEIKRREVMGEAFLDFQVGKSVILPDFKRNPVELEKIVASITRVKNDADMSINSIGIKGFASPDGSYATNDRLSNERAIGLKNYLRNRFNLEDGLFQVSAVAEDWDGFKVLVEESSLSNKGQILDVIANDEAPDRKEARLKNMANYRTILNDFFPQLRRVNYQINYTVRDYSAEEAETLIQMRPEQLSPSELFVVAETYRNDADKWRDIISLTVLLYPEDILANINMAANLLERGDLEEAKRYLDKVADDPRSFNNLGVYYLLTDDIVKAEAYLQKALTYTDMAGENLIELENVKKDKEILEKRRSR